MVFVLDDELVLMFPQCCRRVPVLTNALRYRTQLIVISFRIHVATALNATLPRKSTYDDLCTQPPRVRSRTKFPRLVLRVGCVLS